MRLEDARSWSGSQPHVTKRLYVAIVLLLAVICICGGYLLGISRHGPKGSNEVIVNLTIADENLYKKARRIRLRSVHRNVSEKITGNLLKIFRCSQTECGDLAQHSLAAFVRNCVNIEVKKLLRTIYNATVYVDFLRRKATWPPA